MRKLLIAVLLWVPLAVFAAGTQTVVLDVQNMTCTLCPITVKAALGRVPGVKGVKIDFDRKTATVSIAPDKTNAAALIRATTDAGYPSTVQR